MRVYQPVMYMIICKSSYLSYVFEIATQRTLPFSTVRFSESGPIVYVHYV